MNGVAASEAVEVSGGKAVGRGGAGEAGEGFQPHQLESLCEAEKGVIRVPER